MLRFVGRRIVFILSVSVLIVFFIYLGMQMAGNSDVREPDYDIGNHGQQAAAAAARPNKRKADLLLMRVSPNLARLRRFRHRVDG